ncbi:signaling peptide TAXIMIN 2-like [Quercus robur]|uniref:signaling peptide TAXIMIN 2-like n=1 Tax=Quercus robur TaxID=38942 RepID=UPI0021610F9E|nr:signaling peptide TAXIMIN 2-like [Quercus robur]
MCLFDKIHFFSPLRIQNPKTPKQKESLQRNKETFDFERMGDCRPLGFLLGLPFALVALVLSLVGAVIWVIGTVLSCLCPCCICFAGLANMAMGIVKLPVKVIRWFIEKIPC